MWKSNKLQWAGEFNIKPAHGSDRSAHIAIFAACSTRRNQTQQPDQFHTLKVGRLRRLESLGLAHQIGPGEWVMDEGAETTLRERGDRGDIIKRIHSSLTERGIERGSGSYVLAGERLDVPIIGRLVDRGLDDELKGTAYMPWSMAAPTTSGFPILRPPATAHRTRSSSSADSMTREDSVAWH